MHLVRQYRSRAAHHSLYLRQLRDSGKPAFRKQLAPWSRHLDPEMRQPVLSCQSGTGLEHHFPTLYSQFDGVVLVDVQTGAVVVLVVVLVVV